MLPDTLHAGTKHEAHLVSSDSIFTFVVLDPKDGPLAAQLKMQVVQAEHVRRTPVVEIGAAWCVGCHLLEDAMRQTGMRETMRGMYVIHIDADRPEWAEELPKMGMDISALPTVRALDHNGRPVGKPIVGYDAVMNLNSDASSLPGSVISDNGAEAAKRYGPVFATFRTAFANRQPAH